MKKMTMSVVGLAVLFTMGICYAASDIPNLVGAWSVQAEGGVVLKGADHGSDPPQAQGR